MTDTTTDTIRIEVPAALVEAVREARERCNGDVTQYIGTGEYAPSEYGCALDELSDAVLASASSASAPPAAAQGEAVSDEAVVRELSSAAYNCGAAEPVWSCKSDERFNQAERALIARLSTLRAERDAARLTLLDVTAARDTWAKQCNYASEEAANLRAALATETSNANTYARQRDAAIREADRWRHGVPIEGDYVCPDSLALDAVRAAGSRLAEAVRAMDICAEETGYGFYHPENPHDFSPDEESCTPQEIANHKAACEAYDAGARATPPEVHQHVVSDDGKTIASLLITPWGIGSYTLRDEAAGATLAALRAWDALGKGSEGQR